MAQERWLLVVKMNLDRETFYACNRFRRGADDSCGENIKVEA